MKGYEIYKGIEGDWARELDGIRDEMIEYRSLMMLFTDTKRYNEMGKAIEGVEGAIAALVRIIDNSMIEAVVGCREAIERQCNGESAIRNGEFAMEGRE